MVRMLLLRFPIVQQLKECCPPTVCFVGNGYGNTALHEACRMGHGAVINILLEHGADVNAKNHKGSTPLHMFCYGNPKAGKYPKQPL